MNRVAVPRPRLDLTSALLVALAVASVGCWWAWLPIAEPTALTPLEPRPALLDKPQRHSLDIAPSRAP